MQRKISINLRVLAVIITLLMLATVILIFMANRDLVSMYGGLTARVDTRQFAPPAGPFIIRNVNILAPDGERFIAGQTVAIDNGAIVSVGANSEYSEQEKSADARVVDGKGKYLIPGLTDAHVHLFKSPNDLLLYVANGVTQIRELIGEPDHLGWRQEIDQGRLGPRMFIASPRIGSFEPLEGWFMSWSQGFLNLTEASQAEKAVQELHEQGYDAVKIYSQINREAYQAVATTAKSLGMKVVGHVPWSLQMADLYPVQDGIAHLEELMNAMNREFGDYDYKTAEQFMAFVNVRSDEIADDLLENDIAVTTTLWLVESFIRQKLELDRVLTEVELEYENPGISEWSATAPRGLGWLPKVNRYKWPDNWSDARKANSKIYWETYARACQAILRSLNAKGVRLLAGTDANLPPTVPGFSLHDELISLNRAGMSPAQVLRAATAEPSAWLNSNAGEISAGRKADLVLLDKNPLKDISNTKAISAVILAGRLLDRALLDKILASVKTANNESRKQEIAAYLD